MVPSATPAFAKEIFKSDYESYEGLLRVVIHNRFKFAQKHFPIKVCTKNGAANLVKVGITTASNKSFFVL
jgi:hypothetical protein